MEPIAYQVVRSDRRTIAIQITDEGVLVRAPRRMPERQIREFVQSREAWIRRHMQKLPAPQPAFSKEELTALSSRARSVIPDKAARYAKLVGVTYGRITVRSQHTRWGSCSGKGNLNFNCLLMLVPEKVLDYVIIHELCHRKQMNHSAAFWALVAKNCPHWRESRSWLKQNGASLIRRLPK